VKLLPTEIFIRRYRNLPKSIQEQVDHKLDFLLANPRHPSLHTKKMQGTDKIWELRVSQGYRITFQMEGDLYILRNVGTHDILKRP